MKYPDDFVNKIINGDCLEVMKDIPDNSISAVVTDPPYGIAFMNKEWDSEFDYVEETCNSAGGTEDKEGKGNAYSRSRIRFGTDLLKFQEFSFNWSKEALRILKPGGHLLSFCGTRTYHRMVSGIEDAGFEIRDTITWLYSTGFPKSMNIKKYLEKDLTKYKKYGNMEEYDKSKQNTKYYLRLVSERNLPKTINIKEKQGEILQPGLSQQNLQIQQSKSSKNVWEKQSILEGGNNIQTTKRELQKCKICEMSERILENGEERWICNGTPFDYGTTYWQNTSKDRSCPSYRPRTKQQFNKQSNVISHEQSPQDLRRNNFEKYDGIGTALKPACEFICVARKPLSEKSVAENVLKWGTGGINIDECRVGMDKIIVKGGNKNGNGFTFCANYQEVNQEHNGRFPANLILECICDEVIETNKEIGKETGYNYGLSNNDNSTNIIKNIKSGIHFRDKIKIHTNPDCPCYMLDEQSDKASRFFYTAKASKSERNEGLDKFYCIMYNISKGGALCEENMEQVALLIKGILDLVAKSLNIVECGEKIVVIFPKDISSTIKMEISKIIELKTWKLLTQQPTKECMADVFGKKMGGINHALSVNVSKELMTKIGILQERVMSATTGVKNATYELLLKLKDEKEWKEYTCTHPTVKSLKLIEYIVKLVCPKNGIVIDPFLGSGTTAIACEKLNIKWIGIEREKEYCEIAQARIDKERSQGKLEI